MKLKLKEMALLTAITFLSTAAVWLPIGMTRIFQNFDGPYYIVVAKSWYNKEFIKQNFEFPLPVEYYAAHLPGFPVLINLFTLLGFNYMQAGVVATVATTLAGALIMYKIFEENKWGNPLWAAGVWLFAWPRMWAVRSVISPEPLFILAIITSLYFFVKKQYLWSGIAGAIAAITKSPGVLLLIAYALYLFEAWRRTKKLEIKAWPILLIGLATLGVFSFYYLQTGDFLAYFHSGDNIHLQLLPFRIFDSSQPWVGSWWLEDIVWIYLIGGLGTYYAFRKNRVWGWFGAVYLTVLLFVSHRDIARYSLPLVPVVLLGLSPLWQRKEIRTIALLMLIPIYFYTINFLYYNFVPISWWEPLL